MANRKASLFISRKREASFRAAANTIVLEIRNPPDLDAEFVERLYERCVKWEFVLAGNSGTLSRVEAVHHLRIGVSELSLLVSLRPKDENSIEFLQAHLLKLHHIVTGLSKEYGVDAKKLILNDGNEWFKIEGVANSRDAIAGTAISGRRHAELLRRARESEERLRDQEVSLVLLPHGIREKLERLASDYPEPEFTDRITSLRSLLQGLKQDGYWDSPLKDSSEKQKHVKLIQNNQTAAVTEYSRHRPIAEWLKIFKKIGHEISEDTFLRRRKGAAQPCYRENPASTRGSLSIAIADLPSNYSDDMTM